VPSHEAQQRGRVYSEPDQIATAAPKMGNIDERHHLICGRALSLLIPPSPNWLRWMAKYFAVAADPSLRAPFP
jgi:hypothetical protein